MHYPTFYFLFLNSRCTFRKITSEVHYKLNTFMKYIVLLIQLLLWHNTHAQEPGYIITGYIEGLSDQELYLDYYDLGKRYRHKVFCANGSFKFVGYVTEPVFANIHQQFGKGEIELFLDNSSWKITGEASGFNNAIVKGSVIDQQWKEYFKNDQDLILQAYGAEAVEKGIDEQSFASNTDLRQKRVDLLKRYVYLYKDSYAGALIATFCTINKSLSQNDLGYIYSTLSPQIQISHYGQEIQRRVSRKSIH